MWLVFTNQIVLFEHIYTLAKFVYDTGSCFDPAQQLRPNLLLGTKDLGPGPLINPISTDQCDQIGQLFKALATINLPKTCTFLGNFCKRVKIYHFPSEIIFGQLLSTFWDFFWSHWHRSTLAPSQPFFLNGPTLIFFSFIFGLIKQHYNFYSKLMLFDSSSMQHRYSNSQPHDYKSPLVTDRPWRVTANGRRRLE